MWRELRQDVDAELTLMRRLLVEFAPEFDKVLGGTPTLPQVTAMGAVLQSFYNGVENILKRIAKVVDGGVPKSAEWHSVLLTSMSQPTSVRPAVIDAALLDVLRDYLGFRHIVRTHYAFLLRWHRMIPLVQRLDRTLAEFDSALDAFFARVDPHP